MTKQHKKATSNGTGKIGILLLWIGIFAMAIAGYSYYGTWTKTPSANTNQAWSCPMMQNTTNKVQWWGCSIMGNNRPAVQKTTNPTNSEAKVIAMTYNESWLEPWVINVQAGKSYTIIIKVNTDIYGCMSTISIPWLDNNIQNITKWSMITFNIQPTTPWEYEFECAMWVSHQAKIIVQ